MCESAPCTVQAARRDGLGLPLLLLPGAGRGSHCSRWPGRGHLRAGRQRDGAGAVRGGVGAGAGGPPPCGARAGELPPADLHLAALCRPALAAKRAPSCVTLCRLWRSLAPCWRWPGWRCLRRAARTWGASAGGPPPRWWPGWSRCQRWTRSRGCESNPDRCPARQRPGSSTVVLLHPRPTAHNLHGPAHASLSSFDLGPASMPTFLLAALSPRFDSSPAGPSPRR